METIEKDTMTDEQRRSLFFNFKALGFDDDGRHCFVSDFTDGRTDSLKDLGYIEAQDMLRYLQELRRNPQERKRRDDLDRKRKGVMRAIGEYFKRCGIEASEEYIKATAVRAAGIAPTGCISHDFNRISADALTRIYNEFCRKQSVQGVKTKLSKVN